MSNSLRPFQCPQVLWWKHVEAEYAAEVAAQADVFGGEEGEKRKAGAPCALHVRAAQRRHTGRRTLPGPPPPMRRSHHTPASLALISALVLPHHAAPNCADFRLRVIEHNLQVCCAALRCAVREGHGWEGCRGRLRRRTRAHAEPSVSFCFLMLLPFFYTPQVIGGYYARITLPRLAQMLDLSPDEVRRRALPRPPCFSFGAVPPPAASACCAWRCCWKP